MDWPLLTQHERVRCVRYGENGLKVDFGGHDVRHHHNLYVEHRHSLHGTFRQRMCLCVVFSISFLLMASRRPVWDLSEGPL